MNRNAGLLTTEIAVATPLLTVCIDEFGTECLNWEPEVLQHEMDALSGKKRIPPANFDKVHALSLLLTTDRFWREPGVFIHIANAIGGDDLPVNFKVVDFPEPDECAWSVTEALLLEPLERGEEEDDRFDEDVTWMIRVILQWAGLWQTPRALDWVDLNRVNFQLSDEDPELFERAQNEQRRRLQLIEDHVGVRLNLMLAQMEGLTLRNGSTDELVKRLRKKLSSTGGTNAGR